MGQRLGRRDGAQLVAGAAAERAAGSGDPQLGHFRHVLPQQALVDGTVLGIDRHEGPVVAATAVERCRQRHDEVAPHHQRFLVGQRQNAPCFQRKVAGPQPRSPHQGVHHHVHLGQKAQLLHCRSAEGKRAATRFAPRAQLFGRRRARQPLVRYRHMAHAEATGLAKGHLHRAVHRQGRATQLIGVLRHHIQRLGADRARRTKEADGLHGIPLT